MEPRRHGHQGGSKTGKETKEDEPGIAVHGLDIIIIRSVFSPDHGNKTVNINEYRNQARYDLYFICWKHEVIRIK